MISLDVDLDFNDLLHIGCWLMSDGKPGKSLAFFDACIERNPNCLDAYSNKAGALISLKRLEESMAEAYKALASNPDHHAALLNLGTAEQQFLMLDKALEHIDKSISLNPPYVHECWLSRAMNSQYRGDVHQALADYKMALTINPQSDVAKMSIGLMQMLDGQWDQGLPNYEARISRVKPFPTDRIEKFSHRPADTLAGKKVLICAEQGMGDNIMFARYFQVLRSLHPTSEFTFLCADAMAPWMSQYASNGFNVISPAMNASGSWEIQIPMMSIPLYLHDRRIPFLVPPVMPERFPVAEGGPGVGFCWRGSKDHAHDMFRSMSFETIMQIVDAVESPHYAVCLQSDAANPQKDEFLFAPQQKSWFDTALAINGLDAVVTVDTAVAHMSGTLGVPTFLMLPLITDWRWQMEVPTTPFYPSMRIFRQKKLGDWGPVIEEVKESLRWL